MAGTASEHELNAELSGNCESLNTSRDKIRTRLHLKNVEKQTKIRSRLNKKNEEKQSLITTSVNNESKCCQCDVWVTEKKGLVLENSELKKVNSTLLRELNEAKLLLKFMDQDKNDTEIASVTVNDSLASRLRSITSNSVNKPLHEYPRIDVIPTIVSGKVESTHNFPDKCPETLSTARLHQIRQKVPNERVPHHRRDQQHRGDQHRGHTPVQKRVLLLSDSHGRKLQKMMSSMISDESTKIVSIVKPGAGLEEIVKGIVHANNFGENDTVILMGGTNDINSNSTPYQRIITQALEKFIPLSKTTKIIINEIPIRADRPELNIEIGKANRLIHSVINNIKNKVNKNISIHAMSNKINVSHLNHSGIHLNQKGKTILCKSLINILTTITKCTHKESQEQASVQEPEVELVEINPPKIVKHQTFLDNWLKGGKPN
jgi:hypothetical protein